MPVAQAPAAGVVNVLSVLRRFRHRDFPEQFGQDDLHHVGVPGMYIGKTLEALELLGLLDGDGGPTEAFTRIKESKDDAAYAEAVAAVVRTAYAEVFEELDPASASEGELRSAFRRYEPVEERERMVSLFRGLLAEGGIIGEGTEAQERMRRGGLRQRQMMRNMGSRKN